MSNRFENYKILAEIGRGGMGIVYRAQDLLNDRTVAIKQLILENIDANKHKEFQNRFRREALTASRLVHPNIVKVFEISKDPDSYFYVMEYLEGYSLRKEISRHGETFSVGDYYKILKQVADGLSFAHSMNVVHRDVKPDNIFILHDGTVKVTDFGIARVADLEETSLTKTGVMLGTLAYVSPEQLQNAKTVDHRADIFSLGVVSYEALSGELPFTGDGIAATIVKIMSHEEKPLAAVNKEISPELSATISRALRKRPRDRYRSIKDFIRDFEHAVNAAGGDIRYDTGEMTLMSTSTDIKIDPQLLATSALGQDASELSGAHSRLSAEDRGYEPYEESDEPEDEEEDGESIDDSEEGSEEEPHVPDKTFVSVDTGDFGIKLDKDDILRDRAKVKQAASGRHKPIDSHTGDKGSHGDKGSYGAEKSSYGAEKSGSGSEKSSYGSDRGGYGSQQSRHGSQKSNYGADKGSYASEKAYLFDTQSEAEALKARQGAPHLAPPPKGRASGMAARMAQSDDSLVNPTYQPIKLLFTIDHHGSNAEKPFQEPSVVSYRSGKLIVADAANRIVHMFNRDGRWVCDLTTRPDMASKTGGGKLTKPSGIAIDERGRIYISDSSDHYVRVFDPQGSFIKELKNIQGGDGGLQGIAIDSTGLLYLSDVSNSCLQVFQSDIGVWVRRVGEKGDGPGQLQLPSGLASDRLNRIYVVDYGTCKVSIFNKSGAVVRTFGKKGSQKGMFNVPRGIAVDKHDRIFVLDSLNHRIQVFGSAGDWLYTFGTVGNGPDEFLGPSGLSIDNENNLLFVADKGNKRVQVLKLGFK